LGLIVKLKLGSGQRFQCHIVGIQIYLGTSFSRLNLFHIPHRDRRRVQFP
jgi:hypothetical protein